MASPQTQNGYIRIANELYDQIMMRDFTKRQRAILDLVIRLSFGCGKKQAYIPKLACFEICGVHQKIVSRDLRGLRALNVLGWDESTKNYWLNKDYDEWLIEPPPNKTLDSFTELLKNNLHLKSHHQSIGDDQQNVGVAEDIDQQNIGETTNKTLETLPTKHWQDELETLGGTRADGSCKDSNTDSEKKIVIVNSGAIPMERLFEDYQLPIMRHGRSLFPQTDGVTQKTAYGLAETLCKNRLPVELGCFALEVAAGLGKDERFAVNKLRDWLQVGVTDVQSAETYEHETFSPVGGAQDAKHRGTRGGIRRRNENTVEDFLRDKLEQREGLRV